MYLRLDTIDYNALLAAYEPHLLFDIDEDFHNLDVAAATDFYDVNGGAEGSNKLIDSDGSFAYANPEVATTENAGLLTRPSLGERYSLGGGRRSTDESRATDVLSERGDGSDPFPPFFTSDGYDDDAATMEGQGYGGRIYGRVAYGGDHRLWLQYWVFYYFDPQGDAGFGVHEGDWEMVQLRLDANHQPEIASYAQHSGGETCAWPSVAKLSDGRPIVYVAKGSHAAYFTPGPHPRSGGEDDDYAGGELAVDPAMEQIRTLDPTWVSWPGRWGDSSNSVSGPRFNDGRARWDNPSTWSTARTRACGAPG